MKFYGLSLILALLTLMGCTTIDESAILEKQYSGHVDFQKDSRLASYFEQEEWDTSTNTGFYPLDKGYDALLARIALIESSDASIDMQYYIYRSDETGQLLLWRLIEAAERGVKVRLLLDDMQKRNDSSLASINAHPNIEVRLFNPHQYRTARVTAMLSDFDRLNRRMHNKSLTVDNVATIVGGRNVGNEYFSYETDVDFGDFDVMLYGSAVEQTSLQFDEYWNSDFSIPMEGIYPNAKIVSIDTYRELVRESKLEESFTSGKYDIQKLGLYQNLVNEDLNLHWGPAYLLYDSPMKIVTSESEMVNSLSSFLNEAEDSVVIVSPYFVPTQAGTDELVKAARSGMDITIITNSLASNDVFAVHGWYAKYRQQLVEGGIKLWETKNKGDLDSKWSLSGSNTSLHAKVMFFDKKKMYVGSMNMDPRSAALNTEMGVVIVNNEYVYESYNRLIEGLNKSAYQVVVNDDEVEWKDHASDELLTSEPDASIWLRFSSWMAGILPIEDQL